MVTWAAPNPHLAEAIAAGQGKLAHPSTGTVELIGVPAAFLRGSHLRRNRVALVSVRGILIASGAGLGQEHSSSR